MTQKSRYKRFVTNLLLILILEYDQSHARLDFSVKKRTSQREKHKRYILYLI